VVIFNLFCEVRLDFHSIGDTGVDLEGINIFEALKKRENHSILMLKLNVNGCDEKETEKLTFFFIYIYNHIEELGVNSRIIGIANNTKISYGVMQRLE
jgi:hypothetical protein